MRQFSPIAGIVLVLVACGGDSSQDDPDDAIDDAPDAEDTSTDSAQDAGDADATPTDSGPEGCLETAGSSLPDDVEWIILDGQSCGLL
ncbi:MAG: hypothetical protein ACJAYU_000791 [Bradymonadia bacterium]|jgi:hypothetical protein